MSEEANQAGQGGTESNTAQDNVDQAQNENQQQSQQSQEQGSEQTNEQSQEQTGTQTPPVVTSTETKPEDKPVEPAADPKPTTTPVQTPPTPTPPPAPVVVMEPKKEESPEATAKATDHLDGDSDLVTLLKAQLKEFAKVNSRPGRKPEDFKVPAAKLLQITRFVIQHPKVDVLDALLAFFEENTKGVCAAENIMKGSITLGRSDEQQVGWLVNLFTDLANKNVVRINGQSVLAVLKKPELVGYYNRKVAVLQKAASAAE